VYFVMSMTDLPSQMGYITAGLVGWCGPQIIDKLFEKNVEIARDVKKDKDAKARNGTGNGTTGIES